MFKINLNSYFFCYRLAKIMFFYISRLYLKKYRMKENIQRVIQDFNLIIFSEAFIFVSDSQYNSFILDLRP
jgi:hypothetical protein